MTKSIFEHRKFMGYVSKVDATRTTIHVPSSSHMDQFFYMGERMHGGTLNSYIVIEGESMGFIAKIVSAEISEKERVELSTSALKHRDFHPLLQAEILSTFDYHHVVFRKSITVFPNIGARVYIASQNIIDKYIRGIELNHGSVGTNDFAQLISQDNDTKLDFSFQSLLSRHMVIVGTTGSGKSCTTAKLIDDLLNRKQKVILIDPTGEYSDFAYHHKAESIILGESHVMSYRNLSFQSLFYLFKPAPNVQMPKLREAIMSLKLLEKAEEELQGECDEKKYVLTRAGVQTVVKKEKDRSYFFELQNKYLENISHDDCQFDIRGLSLQLENECIWPAVIGKDHLFGRTNERILGDCSTLITRIKVIVQDRYFDKIFDFQQEKKSHHDLIKILSNFLDSNRNVGMDRFLYIDISRVPFSFNIREIVMDIIGTMILDKAREGIFRENPLTVFAEEAHQFLHHDAENDKPKELDAFESIAKEGRKYGLFLCLTTQLPRDIPIDILSQVGTFIVHRLINQRDKKIVLHALPSASNDVINYLSSLGQGEVIISSSGLKDTLFAKINPPRIEPNSDTPSYKSK